MCTGTCGLGPHQGLSWLPPGLKSNGETRYISQFRVWNQQSTTFGAATDPALFCVVQSIFHTYSCSCSCCAFSRGEVSCCTCPLLHKDIACRSRADHGSAHLWRQTGPQYLEVSIWDHPCKIKIKDCSERSSSLGIWWACVWTSPVWSWGACHSVGSCSCLNHACPPNVSWCCSDHERYSGRDCTSSARPSDRTRQSPPPWRHRGPPGLHTSVVRLGIYVRNWLPSQPSQVRSHLLTFELF